MRKRLIISALFLAGMTMSVEAYTSPPVTVVDDVGTTKVSKAAELSSVVLVNDYADLALVYVNDIALEVAAPAFVIEKPVIISEPVALLPDRPVTARLRYSTNRCGNTDKIYLLNQDIRQHLCRAVFDRTFRLSKQRS